MAAKPIPELTPEVQARFWAKIDRRGPDECWEWRGVTCGRGYGQFSIPGHGYCRAHRVMLAAMGEKLNPVLVVDHLCRNTSCVNPFHLRQVTQRENVLSGASHVAQNPAKTHCREGHPYSGANLRIDRSWRVCRTCRKERQRAIRARVKAERHA